MGFNNLDSTRKIQVLSLFSWRMQIVFLTRNKSFALTIFIRERTYSVDLQLSALDIETLK